MPKRTTNDERWIEYMPVDELVGAEMNPKRHDLATLDDSYTRFGYVEPIIRDERTGRLVAGHGRMQQLVARQSEGKDAPEGIKVVDGRWLAPIARGWASKNDREAEAYLLASNRLVEIGGWDDTELAQLLESVNDVGLIGTGYDERDLAKLLSSLEKPEPDEVPMLPAEPVTRTGDVWLLGRHRLACGNAKDPAVVAAALGGRSIDFVFTSPPYNVGVAYDTYEEDDGGIWEPYRELLAGVLDAFIPHLDDGRMVAWNIGVSPKVHGARQSVLIESFGLRFWRQIVWLKAGTASPTFHTTRRAQRARVFAPNWTHEIVMLFVKGDTIHRGGKVVFDDTLTDDSFVMSQSQSRRDLTFSPGGVVGQGHSMSDANKTHPAPFPLALPRAFMNHLADVGKVVFDPFVGSGTTLMACDETKRVGVGVELSPGYVDVACERFQRMTGEPVRLESSGEVHDFSTAVPRVAPENVESTV